MKEDQFVTGVFRFREWAEQNLNALAIGLGVVVVAIAAIWFFSSQGTRKESAAYELLGRAEMEARASQWQIAIVDFQKVLDDYGSSGAAKLAAFKLANLYYSTNDFEKAEQAFRAYVDKYVLDDISRLSALEGIAGSLGGQGKFQEAAKQYLEVARTDTLSVSFEDDLLHAVENAIKAEDKQTAQDALGLLEKKGVTSERFRTAKVLMIEKGFLAYDKGDYK
jgi:predicted negative regulator of RcsB-dependent stress response